MSLQKIGAQGAANTYIQNADVARSAQGASRLKDADQPDAPSSRGDSVTLSSNARTLAKAREAVQASPDVRSDKVDAIKKDVQAGTYSVSASVLARKMLDQSGQA